MTTAAQDYVDEGQVNYFPPGPVAAEFHNDHSFIRGLMGPVGSGKSSACCSEIVMRAIRQKPWFDGVRRSRWAIIRNTYPELKSTTIKTWQTWFPQNVAPIRWDTPITSFMRIEDIGDGTAMELEVIFLALDSEMDTGKLRSLELTGVWINEGSEIPKGVFDMCTQRVGRYPSKLKGGPSWTGVIIDTNPPDDDHWYYHFATQDTPKNWRFFQQPGGLYRDENGEYQPNPEAENIDNLPGGHQYYLNQVAGKTEGWVNVFLMGNYGTTADGKPVYAEWNDRVHTSDKRLEPVRGLPLILGWDFGLTPACIIGQQMPNGRLQILEEIISEDMGIRQFASDVVRPILTNRYNGFARFSVGDPAGAIRAQTDERTCFQELLELGLHTEPAPTNDFIPRRESVAFFLTRMIDGGPGFLLDPSCTTLRKGFNGRYRYERLKSSGQARYRDRPVKDGFSHPHDALQYLCLRVRNGLSPIRARQVVQASSKGWV